MRMSIIGLAALIVSGCASVQPDPCTTEWVQWRTDKITNQFSRQYRGELRDMRRFASKLENPSPLILIELPTRLEAFQSMATDFSDTVMPELRSAVDQCGLSSEFGSAFTGFLQDQGMPDAVLGWIEEIADTMDALSGDI